MLINKCRDNDKLLSMSGQVGRTLHCATLCHSHPAYKTWSNEMLISKCRDSDKPFRFLDRCLHFAMYLSYVTLFQCIKFGVKRAAD